MSGGTFRVLADADALARAAAAEFAARAARVIAAGRPFTVALAGGSTPRRLYTRLAGEDLPWGEIHLFFGDERHVPPNHPDSNYRMVRESILDRIAIPEGNVHRIPAEEPDAGRVADEYERELRGFFLPQGLAGGDRLRRFDLVLLGMGPDGHTASLFPGTAALGERERWVASPWVEKLAAHRITITFPVINAAAAVIFLIDGSDKKEIVARVRSGSGGSLPVEHVAPHDGELLWLVDRAAAGGASRDASGG
jgi:6-phosphogluconolactonase